MKSDVEIAQEAELEPISDIAEKIGLSKDDIEPRGNYEAKLSLDTIKEYKDEEHGNLILVTTMTPTRGGEGKTTTSIGLTQAFWKMGEKATLGIREPSIGPTMGIKGGAAGGGYSQVLPMEDINLHFTGDMHAIGIAHNLLSAMINNHMHRGNDMNLDTRKIVWPRVLDMNDRSLRNIVVGLGGTSDGMPNETSFGITASSEVMAILCLADGIEDLKERLSDIIIGYTYDREPVTAGEFGGVGAMATLLKHAIKPNLVQTIEGVPAFIHGGPFANIAHGTSSLISTKLGLSLSDYFVTEAGFGSDLGAEKFFNIVCREGDLEPDVAVMVATVRALKRQGGVSRKNLKDEDLEAMKKGLPNLDKHLKNIQMFGVPVVVAINRFPSDTQEEIDYLKDLCEKIEVPYAVTEVYQEGGEGGIGLAEEVKKLCDEKKSNFRPLYSLKEEPEEKIRDIATKIYGATDAIFTPQAKKDLKRIKQNGLDELPICMSKTHYSLSDDRKLRGRPRGFKVKVRKIRVNSGAGFLIPMAGDITTMPGLPSHPAAKDIDIDEDGKISGLF
ncbi:MAG: formate--tetrahydrofolate ligase [Candidatus Thermoplasmatota archaeon]|nr:formate--tetrahydrofolate ligase [Candidatus Thermoplasmatota archaeon]MBS3790399.1 formate--tetrahydrofolate ligase [Candidatus Thermoplasmatota archaeon]